MGGKLGTIFARAGHDVVFSYARSARKLERLARAAKGKARAGTPAEAARASDVVSSVGIDGNRVLTETTNGVLGLAGIKRFKVDVLDRSGVTDVIVLQGGSGLARSYPREVEVKVGLPVTKLHFLGGVAGWGYPLGRSNATAGTPQAIASARAIGKPSRCEVRA